MPEEQDVPIDEEDVRLTAYFLWEQAGSPEGRAQEFWYRAWSMHRRARKTSTELEAGVSSQEDPDGRQQE